STRFFFCEAEDGIRARTVTGVQTCALPISGQQRRHEQAGRDGQHADAELSELARDRQRHRDDTALGGGIGRLPDLAVIGRDRGESGSASCRESRESPGACARAIVRLAEGYV